MKKIKTSIFIALSYLFIFGQSAALAQSTAAILPQGVTQFFDNNGNPLSSGKVYFYIPNTTTFKTTWQDAAKAIPNANPVILDAAGRAKIYGDGTYRQRVTTSNNNQIWDAVTASTGSGGGGTTGTGDGDLVGTIKPWAGLIAPNQYVFAYGQEISRTTYAAFFTATTLNQIINCTSGSPILTGLSDTSQIPVGVSLGAVIEASCIAAGSRVLSKTTTTVTMNNNASLTTSTSAVFFLYGNGNGTSTFNVPDLRGNVIAGRTNMGGTASANLTIPFFENSSNGSSPASTGGIGGTQTRTLVTLQLPPYTPSGTISSVIPTGSLSGTINATVTDPGHNHGLNNASGVLTNIAGATWQSGANGGNQIISVQNNTTGISATVNLASGGIFTGNTLPAQTFTGTPQGGGGFPIAQTQPTITLNYIIKIVPDQNSADASGVTSLGLMTGSIACGAGIICTGNIISSIADTSNVTFPTRAAAIAATISGSTTSVTLLGYSSAGDQGQGAIYIPMSCPVVNPPDFQSVDGRCWHLSVDTPVLGMFGADMTGAADSTSQVNQFITYTYGGNKCGKWGKGTIKINGEIIFDTTLNPGNGPCFYGEGFRFTCFDNINTTSNDFVIDTTVFGTNGGRLTDFGFCHTTPKTSGYSITQLEDATGEGINAGFIIKNIQFVNTSGSIWLKTSQNCAISNTWTYNVAPDQSAIYLGDGVGTVIGCSIDNLWVINGTGSTSTSAVKIGNRVGGVEFSKCHLQGGSPTNMDYGVLITGTLIVADIWFDQCYADAFRKNQVRIDGGTDIRLTNAAYINSGNGFACVRIAGGSSITIQGNLIYGCQRQAVEVLAGVVATQILDNQIYRNGFEGAGSNNWDDVFITGGVTTFTVSGNNFCHPTATFPVATSNTRYNVNVATGASDNYTITGNTTGTTGTGITNCHVTGGVQDSGTGTNKNVSANSGTYWQSWTPTFTCGTGTPTTITVNSARYEIAGPRVAIKAEITTNDIGTCTTSLRMTLPAVSQANDAVVNVLNQTTLTAKNALVIGSIARVDIFANGGVFPSVNGDILHINGVYEAVAP